MLYTPKKINQLKQAIKQLCPQWGLEQDVPISLLNISENATFLYGEASEIHDIHVQRRIIRAYRPFYHDDNEIRSELLWMHYLEKQNIVPLPHIFPIESLDSKQNDTLFVSMPIDGMMWRFAAFSYIEGRHPKCHDNLADWFFTLGVISAHLHLQAQNWQYPIGFLRKSWTFDTMIGKNAYWGNWKNIPNLTKQDFTTLQQCVDALRKIEPTFVHDKAHFGLIHGDLRLANLIIQHNTLCVIDFDDCGFSWYASDLANALSFMEDSPLRPTLIESWLKGYATLRRVSKDMENMLPHLIMMRRIQLSAWLVSHHESSPLQELGESFHHTTIKLAKQYLEKQNLNS